MEIWAIIHTLDFKHLFYLHTQSGMFLVKNVMVGYDVWCVQSLSVSSLHLLPNSDNSCVPKI